MKIKKHLSFSDKNQVWRILISEPDLIIIETRDLTNKQVFFHCVDFIKNKKIFSRLQLDEKYWIGIETIYKGIIYFHKFNKPDMPGHKEIIAFDIKDRKELWRNDYYTFLFIHDDKVFCCKQLFEGWRFYSLDYLSGEQREELNTDAGQINKIRDSAQQSKSYEDYMFPMLFENNSGGDNPASGIINEKIKPLNIIGKVEYSEFGPLLLMNYHSKTDGKIENMFFIFDIKSGRELFSEILNGNASGYVPDSFFIYKNFLILLKEKNEVLIYNLS